ncbi:carboxyltransferase domain-containing protein [Curtobacterium flaccumfaciens]|nr:carboxyltransferase domain-containing protein [Curtobacterium flaccumfaciens]
MTPDVRAAGTSALLLTFDSLDEVVSFRAGLTTATLPGVTGVVSGARTLLVRFDPRLTDAGRLRGGLADVTPHDPAPRDPAVATVVVPVTYDGEDLDTVAETTGLTPAEVVAWHTGQLLDERLLRVRARLQLPHRHGPPARPPRRQTARTIVPSGAVALAGEFSAVYPRASPGGWQLIGRTAVPMWSLDRDPPALAPAGTRVRFVEAGPV